MIWEESFPQVLYSHSQNPILAGCATRLGILLKPTTARLMTSSGFHTKRPGASRWSGEYPGIPRLRERRRKNPRLEEGAEKFRCHATVTRALDRAIRDPTDRAIDPKVGRRNRAGPGP